MTQEEAKEYLDNYRKMYADLAPERFLEALDIMLNEPSLPSNLDKAAEENSKNYYCSCLENHNETGICDGCENVKLAFKAGAEWMAEQGITVEGDVEGNWRNQEDAPYEIYVTSDCLPQDTEFKFGDKVVVQIRKK